MPTLLAYLVYATEGAGVWRRFPADESVRFPGYDGLTSGPTRSLYVPQGETGWEITTQRDEHHGEGHKRLHKADDRASTTGSEERHLCVYSTRPWPAKHEWVSERKLEANWKDVRAYDADDLVHWIEQTPSVGLWLATV